MARIGSYSFLFISLLLPRTLNSSLDTQFQTLLTQLANDGLGVNKMQNHLDHDVKVNIVRQVGGSLIKEISGEISNTFQTSKEVTQKIHDYHSNVYARLGTEPHFYDCCHPPSHVKFTYNERLKGYVNTDSMCYVGVGTNAGKVKHFSGEMVDMMKKNFFNQSTTRWQYVGTEDGVLHIYPSSNSCLVNSDTFDPRFRPWYVQTTTPKPKDVVIVIDSSGSMGFIYGERSLMEIAKDAAKTVVDTLNPNDRVAVLQFSDTARVPRASNIPHCYTRNFSLGTPKNKENIKYLIDTIGADGGTEYIQALNVAFDFFAEKYHQNNGPRDSVILFLTDGKPDNATVLPTIRKRNSQLNNSVVIMTFGIGSAVARGNEDLLKAMAMESGAEPGTFTPVHDPNNLRSAIGMYYQYFSHGNSEYTISVPYYDGFGLGVIASICTQVRPDSILEGVACIDLSMTQLLESAEYFTRSKSSYIFIVDRDGRLMSHPLLPKLYDYESQPLFVDVLDVETDPDVKEIKTAMLMGLSGNKTISAHHVISRGDSIHDGIKVIAQLSDYFWEPVTGSNYSVCLVLGKEAKETILHPSNDMSNFLYHRLDLVTNINKCNHFNQLCSRDKSSVKFTANAFVKAHLYLDKRETLQTVQQYQSIMEGKTTSSVTFRSGVKEAVQITDVMDRWWTNQLNINRTKNYVVWKYIGTENGVFRIFPATPLYKQFDHRMRPWYRKATDNKGKLIITPPYTDAAGAGVIMTLAKTVGRRNNDLNDGSVFGVMGLDFTMSRFHFLMTEEFPECQTKSCFLVDGSGYIIYHKDFTKENNENVRRIHIVEKEPCIALDLIGKGFMNKHACVDIATLQSHYFWIINMVSMVGRDYEIRRIKGTNIFFGRKPLDSSNNGNRQCHCPYKVQITDKYRKCLRDDSLTYCEDPCSTETNFNYCINKLLSYGSTDNFNWPLCSPNAPPVNSTDDLGKDQVSRLDPCFDYQCNSFKDKKKCQDVIGCTWCIKEEGSPKCVYHGKCYYGTFTLGLILLITLIGSSILLICCCMIITLNACDSCTDVEKERRRTLRRAYGLVSAVSYTAARADNPNIVMTEMIPHSPADHSDPRY